jgi:hypothetical protein
VVQRDGGFEPLLRHPRIGSLTSAFYEVPSVVAVPIIDGGPDYLGWILKQTEQRA